VENRGVLPVASAEEITAYSTLATAGILFATAAVGLVQL
jgi:hypothetical protein